MKRSGWILGVLGFMIVLSLILFLRWPLAPIATPQLPGKPGGILGVYFKGENFEAVVMSRNDYRISLNTSQAPDDRLSPDHFSVRWDGYIHFSEIGAYQLCVISDDGVRLSFDHERLIEDWNQHATSNSCRTVRVRKGWYPILVEYFESTGSALLEVTRGRDRQPGRPIPPEDLCCMK